MAKYHPERGDVVWVNRDPQAGHEQSGRRPALVLSPVFYNSRAGLAIICPITSQIKKYTYEVLIPDGFKIKGAILADQVKSVDFVAHQMELIFKIPESVVEDVQAKLATLIR